LWGETPPDTARSQIHAAVTAIRRVLRAADAADLLATRHIGYVLTPESFDLKDFIEYVTDAHEPGRLRQALQLWRGEALADVTVGQLMRALHAGGEPELPALRKLVGHVPEGR
jgi:DNA-binding SARP family transcriptional activator